jgi:AcrR family transcriptional regulator
LASESGNGDARAPGADGSSDRKAQQRQKILDAARQVFFRDGFVAANLDEVAAIAGVAKGTLYRYFENKAELYVAVLATNGEQFERKLRDAGRDESIPAPDRIRRIARFYLEHWTRNREYFQIFWALENQAVIGELPPGVVEEVTRLWENCLRILADVIERGAKEGTFARCDAWEVANILWTVANGLLQAEHVVTRRELRRRKLDRVFEDTVELFLRGLANPASPG